MISQMVCMFVVVLRYVQEGGVCVVGKSVWWECVTEGRRVWGECVGGWEGVRDGELLCSSVSIVSTDETDGINTRTHTHTHAHAHTHLHTHTHTHTHTHMHTHIHTQNTTPDSTPSSHTVARSGSSSMHRKYSPAT